MEPKTDPSRLREIDALFAAALELAGEERAALLAARAAGDPALVAEVEALLARAERSVAGILSPVRAFAAEVEAFHGDELAPGEVVGAYRLVRRLGEGGMGVVFLAERIDGSFERQVALKLLPAAGVDGEHVRRFEQERRILARLEHPRIARLLDGGVDRRGLPYLVMEHVEGLPIDRHADERRLPLEARIALLAEVAGAVQAAHRNLIVHRDLKPSNVLVSAAGEVKLLDFGIAKILDTERGGGGELTLFERRAMTPTYASPEQVNGEPISTASDVYQLGLLLYELLTGLRPQAATTSSLSELVELVCRREPAPPSRAVGDAADFEGSTRRAAARATTPARLARRLRGELDAIVARAIAKAPAERYPTPDALAEDLGRFLEGRPVAARRAPLAFRVRKWIGRNAALAAFGAAALLGVVAYAVTVTFQSRAIDRQRVRAELEATTARAVERFLLGLFAVSDPESASAREITARELLESGAARIESELAGQPAVQARLWSALGQIQDNLGQGETARRTLARALDLQRSGAGVDACDIAETQRRLGVALRRYGDRESARRILAEAVATLRGAVAADDPRLATALADLGFTEGLLGDWQEGEAHLGESLAIRKKIGARSEEADTTNAIGLLLQLRGEPAASEPHFREALAIFRELYGDRHVLVADVLGNLGQSRRALGDIEQALALFTEAAEIFRELYGERHREYGNKLAELAMVNMQLGRLGRADELYGQALAIVEPQLTRDHPQLLAILQGLGALRVQQKRFAEAERLLAEAAAAWRRKPKTSYVGTRRALLWLGRSLAGQGRRDEAVVAWREALAVQPDLDDDLAKRLRAELAAAGAEFDAPAASQPGAGDSSAR